jgi:L-arabinonolactonase
LGTKMYYADTGKDIQTIWYLDYNLENGIPSNKRVFSTTFNLKGRPDGATVDANDCYWVAGIEGSEIYRFDLNGEIDTVIPVPVEKPTKIVFGGNNLQSIYVTSIGKGFDNKSSLNGFTLEISTSKYKGYKTTKFDY